MHPREGWLGGGPAHARVEEGASPAANCCGGRRAGARRDAGRLQLDEPRRQQHSPPLPRQDKPVKWPVYTDNKPIASGLEPEKGATLQLYNWVAYINESVIKSFCKKYNCNCPVTTFNTMEEALSKLASGELKFDVFFPTVSVLGQLVAAKLIRPLNHSYIPNIANVWPDYLNPFYDQGWQYTTPYSIYTTGIAWRKDKVNLAPSWNMPWQGGRYKGKVAVLDDYRESISLALLRAGNLDLNTTSTPQIQAAGRALSAALVATERADRQQRLHRRADREDMDSPRVVGRHGPVDRVPAEGHLGRHDRLLVPARPEGSGRQRRDGQPDRRSNPVLAHKFIDYMLNVNNALKNFSYVGYMQPLTEVTPEKLVSEKLLVPQLTSTVVLPDYFRHGLFELELPPAADAVWESTWNTFSKGL